MIDYQRLKTDVMATGLMAVALFIGLALYSYDPADPPSTTFYPPRVDALNLCGPSGAMLASSLVNAFGLGAWAVLLGVLLVNVSLFAREPVKDPMVRLMGLGVVLLSVCMLLQIVTPRLPPAPLIGNGGYLGAWGKVLLTENFSTVGSIVIMGTILLVGLMLATESVIFGIILRCVTFPLRILVWPLGVRYRAHPPDVPSAPVEPVFAAAESRRKPDVEAEEAAKYPVTPVPAKVLPSKSDFKVNPPLGARPAGNSIMNLFRRPDPVHHDVIGLPSLDMLEEAEEFPFELLATKAQATAAILEKTFDEFGLNVKISEIDTGPVVTQFELDLEKGLRVSKVANLADDLAIALRVPAIRVVSPIPGKNTVGVEVPNEKQVTVRLKELISACREKSDEMRIPIFLGKDVSGRPLVVDMAKMPHLLIAGRTGTGKSVCLNTLIASILMTRSPEEVRMLMIDPKMVELSPYTKIPHLMNPVITDMKKAEAVLAWAVDKMEERYDLLAKVGVRHLDSYNKLGREKVLERLEIDPDSDEADLVPESMPFIVIIADELADLMMTSGKDVESHIIRLAQKSRAVGIHLVLATQKPTVDVITGLIKSNLPARISFQVASRVDSRVVLDEMGAERLLGNGDMLYLAPGTSKLTRAQGTFISDDEVNSIIEFYNQFPPRYSEEIEQATKAAMQQAPAGGGDGPRERDDMYQQAVEVVIREGRGSCSLLQRALGVGYGRAARMIDHMAEDGIVGDYNGSKSREVICTLEQWEDRQYASL
jgi:S-DNA-T family DNA segregation ATPase FtsK/SpoIIIE